jgi:large subunit ribosomal protein L4
VAFARRNRDYRYSMPKKAVRIAVRMALLSKFQDHQALVLDGLHLAQPKTKEVAKVLRSIRRPDLNEAEAVEAVGETKSQASRRTLERRTVLLGVPAYDPLIHRGARNIEGVKVAPVGEFNTYDILRQRYLILTREALASLKEQVKHKPSRRPAVAASNGHGAAAATSTSTAPAPAAATES